MSKELKALERLGNIEMHEQYVVTKGGVKYATVADYHRKDLDIIETALKENKNLKCKVVTTTASCLMLKEELDKKNKALEIIKKTRVDTNIIKESIDYEDYCGLEAQKMLSLMLNAPKQIGITEEEYKVLKEILK